MPSPRGIPTADAFADGHLDLASRDEGFEVSRAQLLEAFRTGEYPSVALADFLHASTRHRCSNSPVGSVLLGIDALAQYAFVDPPAYGDDRKMDRDGCRSSVRGLNLAVARELRALLNPIVQGLALYGELDAAPGTSAAASASYLNTRAVFFERRRSELRSRGVAHFEASEFEGWLASERSRVGGSFERTRAHLRDARGTSAAHPHRASYAWVRTLLRELYRHSEEARRDTDVSLAFLCTFLFDDWRFAELVARCAWSPTASPSHATRDLCGYLRSRVDLLCSRTVALLYDEYVRALTRGTSDACSISNARPEVTRWVRSFVARAQEIEARCPAPRPLANRHVFRFAAFTVDEAAIRPSDATLSVRLDGESFDLPILEGECPTSTGRAARSVVGSIELVLVDFQPLVCGFADDRLIAVTDRELHTVPVDYAEEQLGQLTSFFHDAMHCTARAPGSSLRSDAKQPRKEPTERATASRSRRSRGAPPLSAPIRHE